VSGGAGAAGCGDCSAVDIVGVGCFIPMSRGSQSRMRQHAGGAMVAVASTEISSGGTLEVIGARYSDTTHVCWTRLLHPHRHGLLSSSEGIHCDL
jgi:hypothetical protein